MNTRALVTSVVTTLLLSGSVTASSAQSAHCLTTTQLSLQQRAGSPLPVRVGAPINTSGRVPHVQIGVKVVETLNRQLETLAFSLPGVIKRPTIVSLPGAIGLWLEDDVPIVQPQAIVSGREFSHLHPDGSLHAPLPLERALEIEKKGWGERHPWAARREGWEGLVMLYSATTAQQLAVLFQLVSESYLYVTGRNVVQPGC